MSCIIVGDNGSDSGPNVLRDPDRNPFQPGNVNSFLISVPNSLGPIDYVRVWHDNYGHYPSWRLEKMTIRDCQTNQIWYFICNKWLAVDEDDGEIDRKFRVASPEDLVSFNVLFKEKLAQDLGENHLWFSVFLRPPRSRFSRLQRLSCCLSFLCCTMVSSAMFFGAGPAAAGDDPQAIVVGPITLSLKMIIIGIQSSLVVVPVNGLIIFLFRSAKDKRAEKAEKLKGKTAEQECFDVENEEEQGSKAESENCHNDTNPPETTTVEDEAEVLKSAENVELSKDAVAKGDLFSAQDSHVEISEVRVQIENESKVDIRTQADENYNEDKLLEESSALSQEVYNSKAVKADKNNGEEESDKTDEADGTDTVDENFDGYLSEVVIKANMDLTDSRRTSLITDDRLDELVAESTEGDDEKKEVVEYERVFFGLIKKRKLTPEEAAEYERVFYGLIKRKKPSPEELAERERKAEEKRLKNLNGSLPHWVTYIAWVLCFFSSTTTALFTIFYSMMWGKKKSNEWLTTMVLSFFQDTFVSQPIKIICIAVFFALVIKKPAGKEEVEASSSAAPLGK